MEESLDTLNCDVTKSQTKQGKRGKNFEQFACFDFIGLVIIKYYYKLLVKNFHDFTKPKYTSYFLFSSPLCLFAWRFLMLQLSVSGDIGQNPWRIKNTNKN